MKDKKVQKNKWDINWKKEKIKHFSLHSLNINSKRKMLQN